MSQEKKIYGLIGKKINYSFSKKYFTEKFLSSKLNQNIYKNFDLSDINEFKNIIKDDIINGLNVTIPYKEKIIPFLDKLDDEALKIGAVNTIKFDINNKLIGYNTDHIGFLKSIKPFIKREHKKAMLLGSGGASKAIIYALKKINISCLVVSRNSYGGDLTYNLIDSKTMKECQIIINCSPLGTFPKIKEYPDLPYKYINEKHICYDLIYNPIETEFLKKCKKQKATLINGMEMLEIQADESWKIWNS